MEFKTEAVRRAQEYIESHLTEKLTLAYLADTAGYSPWHFARMFTEVTGMTVSEYIRYRRLTEAVLAMRNRDVKIIDAAMDAAFDTHEGFTRAFTRKFGITPAKYRAEQIPLSLFFPYGICSAYRILDTKGGDFDMDRKNRQVFVQVIEKPARKVLLRWGRTATEYFEYCAEVPCETWDILCGIHGGIFEPVGMWIPEKLRPEGTSEYVHGVEMPADWSGEVPEGFDVLALEPCTMIAFQGETYDDEEDYPRAVGEVRDFMAAFDPGKYGYRWAHDAAPHFQTAPTADRGYMEAWAAEKI